MGFGRHFGRDSGRDDVRTPQQIAEHRRVGRWAGDVDGTALELHITTNHLGAWEIRLREPGGRQVTRWFDGPEQAHTYAASVFAAGAWRRVSSATSPG
ncbi:hypothetical protein [Hamadaea tsunoensis]|uniref:hypothetical protein n=1 Tax=Hamadaea tsunoensis TaxID=53368 RepID=UPI0003FBFA73|nr:hypothetical protein [Hamadaea tsunoensis]